MSVERMSIQIVGIAPLLMKNGHLADPLNPYSKQMKVISAKRKKTEADFEQLAKIEFLGSLYLNSEGVPIIPSHVIEAVGIAGAKKVRDGQIAKAAFFADDAILEYDGPKNRDELWSDMRFRNVAGVRVGNARIIRTRPQFTKWSITIGCEYENEIANPEQIREWFVKAGQSVGFGDWRPKFGRFNVV